MSPVREGDTERGAGVMSPSGIRSGDKPNGMVQPNINNSLRGGKPVRPMREDGDDFDADGANGIITGEQQRAVSPDQMQMQMRATSPNAFSSNRAASPITQVVERHEQQPLSMATAVMNMNGSAAPRSASPAQMRSQSPVVVRSMSPTARSASPLVVVERGKSSMDEYYAPKVASPTVNGFAHGSNKGSTGNITADLIRDLKEKEADIEQMKKREAWMKAALAKATRSGFIYADADALGSDNDDEDIDSRRVAEMVISLKHVKAQLQVSIY